ncbi:nucleoside-diphosphate sugar epimerase [Metasolibacillus meyeri]|uniref:Nucleoside-diphosphate sugar epimerase n=1 Tax=Metasolibacillus meyeri TaxID=1071052 RepID=A0AAW9NXZ1_9BACL|nr:nucleoside-diphosphate sugar epimerase [Metasolibacillus meyeri]MEC1180451.1 nucleoside-diphosphate sugar epimerase [Metasolibacillus meyeri]
MLKRSWLISMAISLFGVMMIEYFFTFKPENTVKHGNLGIIGLALVVPFILLSLFITFRFSTELSRQTHDKMLRTILLIAGVGLVIATAYYALQYKDEVYTSLGGTTRDADSKIYGLPLLNEYTNRIFINYYTFLFIHTLSAIGGTLYGIAKPKKIDDEHTELE